MPDDLYLTTAMAARAEADKPQASSQAPDASSDKNQLGDDEENAEPARDSESDDLLPTLWQSTK